MAKLTVEAGDRGEIWKNHPEAKGMTEDAVRALKPGDRVVHRVFGDGTIERQTTGPYGAVVIRFDHFGLKELVVSFAAGNLSKI